MYRVDGIDHVIGNWLPEGAFVGVGQGKGVKTQG